MRTVHPDQEHTKGNTMKIGTKITATNSGYKPDVPNGTIMTVARVFNNGHVNAMIYGSGGSNWFMLKGTFEEHTPLPYGHATMPDGRTVDLTANRVRVDLMDPDELQAMKDHGGPWEIRLKNEWDIMDFDPYWNPDCTYRVAHKPVVRTQTIYGTLDADVTAWGTVRQGYDTHKITLTIQDGDIIDTKTEKL